MPECLLCGLLVTCTDFPVFRAYFPFELSVLWTWACGTSFPSPGEPGRVPVLREVNFRWISCVNDKSDRAGIQEKHQVPFDFAQKGPNSYSDRDDYVVPANYSAA